MSIDVAASPGKSNARVLEIVFYPHNLLLVIFDNVCLNWHQIRISECEIVDYHAVCSIVSIATFGYLIH